MFPTEECLERVGKYWFLARDGMHEVRHIFDRHYSRIRYKDGRRPALFVGPGEKMVLVDSLFEAIFIWRKFKSDDGQVGVNCAVFRNEGQIRSSELILDAERVAWKRWPNERFYTYISPSKIKSTNPGFCFMKAGWNKCGVTKKNKLIIMEKHAKMDT